MVHMRWLVAAVGLLALFASRSQAAPDNKLGMALLSAGIHTDGSVAFHSGLESSSYTGPGNRLLIFDRDISRCAQVVTPRSADVTAFIQAIINPAASRVFLQRRDTGALTDAPFHMMVFCNE